MNHYYCKLTDKYYTEATIKSNLSKAYKEKYLFDSRGTCEGCNKEPGVCSAHIIPKAVLKTLHLTSLIWSPKMFFRSCHKCNMICENISSTQFLELKNIDRIKEVILKYDPGRATKFKDSL